MFYEGGHVSKPKIYTVRLDLTDSNPSTWATYEDAAVGMTAGSDDWDAIFGHYPCILNNGTELGKLKRSDFSKYEDNTSAPITTLGNDVMICFPRRGIKIEKANNGTELVVSLTEAEGVEGFSYKAHTYKGVAVDKFYIGAYKGYVYNSNLYSVSGQTPTCNDSGSTVQTTYNLGNIRTYAHNKGTGYEQSTFYNWMYRQVLYCLKYKAQNSQTVIGRGFSNVGVQTKYGNTGYTDDKGMDWGENTGTLPMKLFGIEDFYGNVFEYIDGCLSDANMKIYVCENGNFNNEMTGYVDTGIPVPTGNNYGGAFNDVKGDNVAGFLANGESVITGTSYSTYFCDSCYVNPSKTLTCGGLGNYKNAIGVFFFYLYSNKNYDYQCGSRLMYFPS